ncbi:MAG: hypothetical protein JWQ10_2997 [Herbaspirillum sp.]|jgi:hypothetical protein|nr:hypothetical protein [Herbaspirillum sp.]
MDVLFNCFVIGLVSGIPVWILMQYLRPRIRFLGLPSFGGGLEAIHIDPVVLDGRFVASVAYALDVAPTTPTTAPAAAATTDAPEIETPQAADAAGALALQPAP